MFKKALAQVFRDIVESIVQPMPAAYMDDMNYGIFADSLARKTAVHPAVCLAIFNQVSPYIKEDSSLSEIAENIKARNKALSPDARLGLLENAGLSGHPTAETTNESSRTITDKAPACLQYLNFFPQYIV